MLGLGDRFAISEGVCFLSVLCVDPLVDTGIDLIGNEHGKSLAG